MARDTRWWWIGGATLGILAIGGIAYAASSSPAAPTSTLPGGGGGGGSSNTNVPTVRGPSVTDPVPGAMVKNLQETLAQLIAQGVVPGTTTPPLNLPNYTVQDVDGNPQNPKFVAVLKTFQLWMGGQKVHVNTSGVLDYGTASLLLIVWILRNGFVASPVVTEPSLIAMAQTALATETKLPVGAFPIDGTANPAFTKALATWQQEVVKSTAQFKGERTDGTLDYTTLAALLVQAYLMP